MNGLATVDPASMDVARLMVYGLLGPDWEESPYTQTGDRIAELETELTALVKTTRPNYWPNEDAAR
jgi:hypothetical protein